MRSTGPSIPGVAFDERGYRLGRGAGHYDRLLPAMRADAVCWAFCLSCQLVPRLPIEPHDVPLDGITTPDRTVRARGDRAPVEADHPPRYPRGPRWPALAGIGLEHRGHAEGRGVSLVQDHAVGESDRLAGRQGVIAPLGSCRNPSSRTDWRRTGRRSARARSWGTGSCRGG